MYRPWGGGGGGGGKEKKKCSLCYIALEATRVGLSINERKEGVGEGKRTSLPSG